MALYQNSVLKTYLALQDKELVFKAYKKFTKYFHNSVRQQNIREIKEEGFQQKFLMELFVTIFGYTINPDPKYNLTTEFKNEKGAKKADGAILKDSKALGVIELKSTKLKDLEKIRQQAFDYKANQTGCVYVITSNFEKLRFYINNAVEFEEFNLFTLTEEQFQLMYLCLAKDNILNNLPLTIKQASIQKEKKITDDLYKDYSLFKRELFRDLVKQNIKNQVFRTELNNEDKEKGTKNIKRTLFKKSQKLIDRFLFIFFAEDSTLLTSNSTKKILDKWKADNDFGDERPLYNLFKQYFNDLDTGRQKTNSREEIFAYNGGLFKPDAILDSLLIDNDLLYNHVNTLQSRDFESEVDVNILGHIFENSLNEIESINAEIDGVVFDKQKAKRKKDGVFYTPKYITKYIVDNTVGKLCSEKKEELGISNIDTGKNYLLKERRTVKKEIQVQTGQGIVKTIKKIKTNVSVEGYKLIEIIETYRSWLLQITICDPACGSGAFLNQSLDFLIKEHGELDELMSIVQGKSMVFPDIENTVLENNIYGVDLNEESVEIAKLSLWLRTAQPRRKLNSLSNNIKCGNSLIDSKTVAGDKSFKWEEEFPKIFAKGGFDVIIGNPPYGIFLDSNEEEYYKKNFPLTNYKINLYILFIERIFQIFEKGLVHFIIPKSLLFNTYFENIRRHLLEKSKVHEIFMLAEKVFPDAEVGGSLILKFERNTNNNEKEKIKLISADTYFDFEGNKCIINDIEQSFFLNTPHCEISPIVKGGSKLLIKLRRYKSIKDYYKLKNGLNPGNIKHILVSDNKESDKHKPIIWGKEFNSYSSNWGGQYVNYDPNLADNLTLDDIKSKEGMKKQTRIDFALRTPDLFENTKLLVRKTGDRFVVTKDTENLYFDTLVHGIYQIDENYSLDFLLAVLNSKPATSFYRLLHDIKGKVFAKISLDKLGSFPLPEGTKELRNILSEKATNMLTTRAKINKKLSNFLQYLTSQFSIEKFSKKLQSWHELEFEDFIKELNKAIKKAGREKLTKLDEMEWMEVFETKKAEAQQLKSQIDKLDKEIDRMVYELYGLNEEEIKIIL
ncbi:N-6 DNA methylase [Aquimarina sp. AU58]|uniref:Eco57I restriction-modification methylase domain-containing protein n=1 Tax=Aquimarina sp. AU58 TaxID=1874112 RepID=UPI000D6E3CCF|nr:N-6 DNA methylase [Aquimarina sp. AU58]